MTKRRIIAFAVVIAAVIAGMGVETFASKKVRKTATFKVRIENISNADGLGTTGGSKYPFALSPGFFVVNHKKHYFFDEGKTASKALEAQAEDGNPELLAKKLLTKLGSLYIGVFNKPVGTDMAAPILPGGAYEFTFRAEEGMRLNLISMFGQSNDLFYAPKESFDLFDASGNPLSGDLTDRFLLWDAGTEVNQAPGVGDEQAPRQKEKNTGKAEGGKVALVKDGFTYPETKDVLRITITAE
ncbi:MAG TPA: spondin domain-containing protein [Pyrinomonadaceae bacterium]|nr:spondin domain-containing protein [Pyrinomonadaceae bacterium]